MHVLVSEPSSNVLTANSRNMSGPRIRNGGSDAKTENDGRHVTIAVDYSDLLQWPNDGY